MAIKSSTHPPERVAMTQWAARIGAVTAAALARREGCSVASARARLDAAARSGLLERSRPLAERPALYTLTRSGLRMSGLPGIEPARVSAANAWHAIVCAAVAAELELSYPDHRLIGERELRRDEREAGQLLASAPLGSGPDGATLAHRPDLVLWPEERDGLLPVAVEVELTVKAPRRLREICRAWARCRCVAGVLYLVSTEVRRPLERAIADARAGERIVVVDLAALAHDEPVGNARRREPSPSQPNFVCGGSTTSNGDH
jgi:hypothetical protein